MTATRIVPFLIGAAVFLVALPAAAKGSTRLALDLDWAMPSGQHGFNSGPGGAIRLGEQTDLVLAQLVGELGGGYQPFSGTRGAKLYTGFIGGRIAFGKILEPGLYGHLGIAHLHVNDGPGSRTAPRLDAGLFLDLTVLPLVNVGVHGGYDSFLAGSGQPAFNYFVAGLHGALVF